MFYYYGSKHRLARFYPLPLYGVIVEPFAGAAGYSIHHLARGTVDRVILIEKDPRVCALWRRLLTMTPGEVSALAVPEPGQMTNDFLYMTAATSNGIGRSHKMTVTERMPREIGRMLRRIAMLLPVVRNRVEIIEGDFQDAPEIEATWFIDPPYQPKVATPNGPKTGSPQGMGYAKGCDSGELDYAALGEWCRSRPGQVIVAEQYPADWLPFSFQAISSDSSGAAKNEVVWHSHPTDRPALRQLAFC